MNSQTIPRKLPLNWTNILFLILTPLFGLIAAPIYIHYCGFHWSDLVILVVFYGLTGLGITMGYHRLFAHKAFEAHPIVKSILLILGAATFQNSAFKWASDHRFHHQHVDQEHDPYNIQKGFWYAHIGWVFFKESPNRKFDNVKDLNNDPIIMWQDKHYLSLAFGVGWLLPLLIGFFFGRPFGFFLWGGLIRTVLVHHGTFFINSMAHFFGKQTYDDQCSAKDSWWLAFFALGEGFHNFHHKFQVDYRNGVRWFHWDPSKWVIRLCSWFGLTHNLRRMPDAVILRRRLEMDIKRVQKKLSLSNHSEHWIQIKKDLDHARLVLEKALTDWKKALHEYAHLKQKIPQKARELRAQCKWEIKRQKMVFQQSLKNWNQVIHFYSTTPQLA